MFDSSIICKSSIVKEDFNDMWCSVHVSIETPVPSMIQAIRHADPIKVRRYRTTIEGHYVDIIENILEHDLPRVEIEVCDPKEFKLEAMMVVVRLVCDIMNGNYPLSFYDWKDSNARSWHTVWLFLYRKNVIPKTGNDDYKNIIQCESI